MWGPEIFGRHAMSFESLMGVMQRLNASTEALAALGAELRLRRDGAQAELETRQPLQDIVGGIDPTLLDGVSPQQESLALAVIGAGFHHAVDLLEDPARAPGWLHQDPAVLQTIERMSGRIVHQIDAIATLRPAIRKRRVREIRAVEKGKTLWSTTAGGRQARSR